MPLHTDAEGHSTFGDPPRGAGTHADASKRTRSRTGQMADIDSVKERKIYLFILV